MFITKFSFLKKGMQYVMRNSVGITWLGTAGVLISDHDSSILIDPYVSRFGIFKIAFGLRLQPNRDAVAKWLARLGKIMSRLLS